MVQLLTPSDWSARVMIPLRTVRRLLAARRIVGAVRLSERTWRIPSDATVIDLDDASLPREARRTGARRGDAEKPGSGPGKEAALTLEALGIAADYAERLQLAQNWLDGPTATICGILEAGLARLGQDDQAGPGRNLEAERVATWGEVLP